MTIPMFPFPGPEWTINVPGHFKGLVCHSCPKTMPGVDLYIPLGWTLKSCEPVSSSGGHGCLAHQYVASVEVVHQDFVGENTHPIEVRSVPPGAQINVI
ncbi:MAG: hypothetical protein ACTSPB_07545 [Candidatus Thorarchaeota archaeon]